MTAVTPQIMRPTSPQEVLPPVRSPRTDRTDGYRFARGGPERLALAGLLAGTALLYLVGLSKSGWANQFYAAAGQAARTSWKAMLFGSLDQSNFITVDKPPASLWVMGRRCGSSASTPGRCWCRRR